MRDRFTVATGVGRNHALCHAAHPAGCASQFASLIADHLRVHRRLPAGPHPQSFVSLGEDLGSFTSTKTWEANKWPSRSLKSVFAGFLVLSNLLFQLRFLKKQGK